MAKNNLNLIAKIGVGLLFLVFVIYHFNSNKIIFRQDIKPKYYFGVVLHKYLDSSDRNTPMIILNNYEVIPIYVYEAYDYIEIGDTIIKQAGSLRHIIKRKGCLPRDFYPIINGKQIK